MNNYVPLLTYRFTTAPNHSLVMRNKLINLLIFQKNGYSFSSGLTRFVSLKT